MNHSIAPRRNREDMNWRFWSNPNKKYFTLIQEEKDSRGYVVISIKNGIAYLDDYAVLKPSPINYSTLFNKLLRYLKLNDIYILRVRTTSDNLFFTLNEYFHSKDTFINKAYKNICKINKSFMPRYVTNLGLQKITDKEWHVTNILTEGI